jgi:DNA modification methylase
LTDWLNKTHLGDCRILLVRMAQDGQRAHACITSPPYFGLRDYQHSAQLGREATPETYISALVDVFRLVRRVLREDGTLWLNLGDSYRAKQLLGVPWRTALALQADGWFLRSDIIWAKPNPMPESITDRPTKSHEYLFLLAKSERYYYDSQAIKEPAVTGTTRGSADVSASRKDLRSNVESRHRASIKGGQSMQKHPDGKRNKRTVWTIPPKPRPEAHFATFPPALVEPCVLAGIPVGGVVIDPFMGSGTTARMAIALGRQYIGCELNPDYIKIQDALKP